MSSYLVFSDLASAQARSAQQAIAQGCTAPTLYWWGAVQHPTNGQAALVIAASGDYGQAGLTAGEIAQLQTAAQLTAAGWTL